MNDQTRWQDAIENEELRHSPVLDTFKSPEEAYKGLIELKAYQGRSLRLPGDQPTPEEKSQLVGKLRDKIPGLMIMPDAENEEDVQRFWSDLGVPKEVDDYQPPVDTPELPKEFVTGLKNLALKAGLTKTQFDKMITGYGEAHMEVLEQQTTKAREADAQLKQTLGSAYDETLQVTDSIVEQFQDPKAPVQMDNGLRLLLRNLSKSLSNDPQVFKQVNTPEGRKTPAELRMDVEEMRTRLLDRTITGSRRQDLMKRYQKTFDELAQYKQS